MTVVVTAHCHQPLPRALLNARHGEGGGCHGAEQSRDPALGSMTLYWGKGVGPEGCLPTLSFGLSNMRGSKV